MHKRVMALLLSLVLLVSAIMPTTAMAAEDEGGSFVFVAMNANSTPAAPRTSRARMDKPSGFMGLTWCSSAARFIRA